MPPLNIVLNERIARIARKEIKAQTGTTKKATTRYRRDIAALKREIDDLTRRLALLEKQVPKQPRELPSEVPEGVRYSPRTVKAMRAKLGLSAREFGTLIGVTEKTVYGWEAGSSRPRDQQLARLVALRGVGKREVVRRLVELTGEEQPAGQGSGFRVQVQGRAGY